MTEIIILNFPQQYHPNHKILMLTYTNHALDQFCEYLIKDGYTDICRLGGRSRSEIVQNFIAKSN